MSLEVIDSVLEDIEPELGNLTHEQHCLIIFYEWHGLSVKQIATRVDKSEIAVGKLLESGLHIDTKRHLLVFFANSQILTDADGHSIDLSEYLELDDGDDTIQTASKAIELLKKAVLQTLSIAKSDGIALLPSEISKRLNIDPTIESDTKYYNLVRDTLLILESEGHACRDSEETKKWRITERGVCKLKEYLDRELDELVSIIEDNEAI